MADYTTLTSKELTNLLSHYDIGKLIRAEHLDGGQANSSLKIFTEQGIFILSVCDEKQIEDINCLVGVLFSLVKAGIPTTTPVKTITGNYQLSHKNRPVYLKQFVPGQVTSNLTTVILHQLGSIMATMHHLSPVDELPIKFSYGLEDFDDLLESDFSHPYLDWLRKKRNSLVRRIDPDMKKSFIHGDIFWDNLVVNDNSLAAILDFEEACYYYTLFDLGMCVVGCCTENKKFDTVKIESLLTGYTSQQPLTSVEYSQLPIFVEYAAVATSFWRFRQYNINYPDRGKTDSYLELSNLADQAANLGSVLLKAH